MWGIAHENVLNLTVNKIAFQSKADNARKGHTDTLFGSCDLDLDPMTLMYELEVDILMMYLHTNKRSF